jgi:hypothetical protein
MMRTQLGFQSHSPKPRSRQPNLRSPARYSRDRNGNTGYALQAPGTSYRPSCHSNNANASSGATRPFSANSARMSTLEAPGLTSRFKGTPHRRTSRSSSRSRSRSRGAEAPSTLTPRGVPIVAGKSNVTVLASQQLGTTAVIHVSTDIQVQKRFGTNRPNTDLQRPLISIAEVLVHHRLKSDWFFEAVEPER